MVNAVNSEVEKPIDVVKVTTFVVVNVVRQGIGSPAAHMEAVVVMYSVSVEIIGLGELVMEFIELVFPSTDSVVVGDVIGRASVVPVAR